jgi:hypothetical protein
LRNPQAPHSFFALVAALQVRRKDEELLIHNLFKTEVCQVATDITLRTQEIIYLLAADPMEALERTAAIAANTSRQHIRVRLQVRQRRPVRLTLKVSLGENGERIVSLPDESGE